MAIPTIKRLPEAPSRQNSAGTFAAQADTFLSALPQFGDQINQTIDHIGAQVGTIEEIGRQITSNGTTQVERATQQANTAAQSAQAAASQASAAREQADSSRSQREAAQAAAAAAQTSAGLPATAGKAGAPLIARPDGGVEFSSSLRRYDLSLAASTAVLDLAQSQVFKIDASIKRTLSFANAPAGGRAMTVVLHVTGTVEPAWPSGILWNNSQTPVMGTRWTTIILIWIGDGWVGSVGARS